MHVLTKKQTSRCTDGSVVNEYILSDPVDTQFISILEQQGSVTIRNLGALQMITFQDGDWLSMKGMTGDSILYITHRKTDKKRAEQYIDSLTRLYNTIKA